MNPARLGELLAMLLAAAPGTQASTPVTIEPTQIRASVDAVDRAKRTLTVRGPQGNPITLKVGPAVGSFAQVRSRDQLTLRYLESVAVLVRAPGDPPAPNETGPIEVVQRGHKPEGLVVHTLEVSGKVESVDLRKRTVILSNSDGHRLTLKVDPAVKRLQKVKPGDQVVVRQTENVAVDIQKP